MRNEKNLNMNLFKRYAGYVASLRGEDGMVKFEGTKSPSLSDISDRMLVARSLLSMIVLISMEWEDDDHPVTELVESGNRAVFKAMRNYQPEEDGDLCGYLKRSAIFAITYR